MRRIFSLIIISLISISISMSQNVGQKGDSIVNYKDINGLKQGKWSKIYKNKKVAYTATFKNDKFIGEYHRFYKNGRPSLIVNYDLEGKESGYGRIFYDNKKLASEGNYIKKNIKDGLWKYYAVDGRLVMEITYSNGVKNGKELTYWSNGKVMQEKNWKNGVEDGLWAQYFQNGSNKLKTRMVNGKRDGLYYVYYPNGHYYAKGAYKNNLRDGRWIYADTEGKVTRDTEYTNGIPADQDKIDKETTRKLEEYEQMKGLIPDPTIDNMFKYSQTYGPISK